MSLNDSKVINREYLPFCNIAIIRSSSVILSPDSYNIQELGLAKALMLYGVSTDIFMAGQVKKTKVIHLNKTKTSSIRLILLSPVRLPGKQALFPGLYKLLEKNKYDVIQVHEDSQITSVFIACYAKKKRTPLVLCQGMYCNYEKLIPRIMQLWYDFTLLPFLRKNVVLSIAKTTRAAIYLEKKKFTNITVCPVGLNYDKFSVPSQSDIRQQYGIKQNDKILLYVGILEKRRNPDFLLQVFMEIARNHDDIILLIVGNGPEKKMCEKRVHLSVWGKRIKLIGRVPQELLPAFYNEAYLFLLPSNYEIFGMVVLEAMYFGVPVIASSTAGTDDIIENGRDGIVISDINILAWTNAIVNLLTDTEKRNSMAMLAKEKIRNKYLWEKAVERFIYSYKKAVTYQHESPLHK